MGFSLSLQVEGTKRLCAVLGVHDLDEVSDTVAVTVLVVVPGDQLDKGRVQLNSGLGVKDARAVVTNEVRRNDLILGVADDSLVGALRGILDDLHDLLVLGRLGEA